MTVVATNMKMCLSVKNNVIDKYYLSKKRKQLNVFTQNCTVFKRLSLETGPPFYVVTWACMRLRAIFAGQRQYLLIILIKDPKFDLALGFEPATSPALQSTSLPTEPNGQVKLLPNGSLYLSGKLPTYPSPKPT